MEQRAEGWLGGSLGSSGQLCPASLLSPLSVKGMGEVCCCAGLEIFLGVAGEAGWDPRDERLSKKASHSL